MPDSYRNNATNMIKLYIPIHANPCQATSSCNHIKSSSAQEASIASFISSLPFIMAIDRRVLLLVLLTLAIVITVSTSLYFVSTSSTTATPPHEVFSPTVQRLLAKLSLKEKIGQMTQVVLSQQHASNNNNNNNNNHHQMS
jgi:hypothetical protein